MAETTYRLGDTGARLDLVAVQQGVEREHWHRKGLKVRVLPAGDFNPRFRNAFRDRAMEIGDRNGSSGEVPSWTDDAAFVATAIVADMSGIYDADGNAVAYTPAVGERVLSDPENADLLAWIVSEALQHGSFYTERVEKQVGNSRRGSGGKRAGAARSARTRS